MTWLHDNNDFDHESPPEEPEVKRRIASIVVSAFVLAIIGSASAFAWRAYGGTPYPSFSLGSSSASSAPKTVGLDEFQAFQQQITGQTQSNAQALTAQQAELKRLSDQMWRFRERWTRSNLRSHPRELRSRPRHPSQRRLPQPNRRRASRPGELRCHRRSS
jgi:hypothetical protein